MPLGVRVSVQSMVAFLSETYELCKCEYPSGPQPPGGDTEELSFAE